MSIDLPQPDSTGRVVPPGVVVSGGGTAGSPPPADALEVERLRREVRRLREALAEALRVLKIFEALMKAASGPVECTLDVEKYLAALKENQLPKQEDGR